MESIVSKGTKPEFLHFVVLTLENRMPWKTLNNLLIELAPSLNETREIINILLKELETLQSTLQKKEKELAKYREVPHNTLHTLHTLINNISQCVMREISKLDILNVSKTH